MLNKENCYIIYHRKYNNYLMFFVHDFSKDLIFVYTCIIVQIINFC